VDFTFFAPVIQNYNTEKTQDFSVAVQPAAGGTGFVAIGGSAEEQRRKIEVFDSERMPVITDIQALETRSNNLRRKLKTSALCIPFFLMAGIVLLHFLLRQRRRLSQDHGFARRYYAKAHCLKTFEEVKTAEDPVETLYRGLATFVADMLNLEAAGLTASDVDALLQAHGAGEEARELTGRVLRACERARYAGRSSTQEEIAALLDAALSAVEKLHPSLEKSS
jgi:hypothetical protein